MSFNEITGLYEGYIYTLTNDINNKVYIGQTTTSLSRRFNAHIMQSKYDKNKSAIYKAIRKYGRDHFSINALNKYDAKTNTELVDILNNEEIYFITYYNSIVPNGYNLSPGGGQTANTHKYPVNAYDFSETLIKEYDSATDASKAINGSPSNILACCRGESRYHKGFIWRFKNDDFDKFPITFTEEELASGRMKMVDQYSLTGEYIRTYESLSSAARSIGESDYSSINHCCIGDYKSAHGFLWRYHNDPIGELSKPNRGKPHAVKQYNLDGTLINVFETCTEAASAVNAKCITSICKCCKGECPQAHGYIWRYLDDDFLEYPVRDPVETSRPVNQYTSGGEYVKSFISIGDAGNDFSSKTARSQISKCCRGILKTAYGYKWFYADDVNQPDKTKIISR